jgi:hypothetical protein
MGDDACVLRFEILREGLCFWGPKGVSQRMSMRTRVLASERMPATRSPKAAEG